MVETASSVRNDPGGQVERQGEWLPIESAPLATPVLVYDGLDGICVAQSFVGFEKIAFEKSGPYWLPVPASAESDSLYPTHWMHLPEPPK